VEVGLKNGFGAVSTLFRSENIVKMVKKWVKQCMKVSVMARGDDWVNKDQGEGIDLRTGMWSVTCDR
jgi:hypothetical protein